MANEWVKVELYGQNNDGDARRFTIADGTSVSKGTLMTLTDPRTITVHSTLGAVTAGVAAMEKEANDGSTSLTCWTNGIFEVLCSGAIGVGSPIRASDQANEVSVLNVSGTIQSSGAAVLGYAMETAADDETINVRLRL